MLYKDLDKITVEGLINLVNKTTDKAMRKESCSHRQNIYNFFISEQAFHRFRYKRTQQFFLN